MANRVVLNCRKVSRGVTYTVTGKSGKTVIVVDDDDDNINVVDELEDDDGVSKEKVGGRKEVLSSVLEDEDCGEGVSGLGIPTLDCHDCQWP